MVYVGAKVRFTIHYSVDAALVFKIGLRGQVVNMRAFDRRDAVDAMR